MIKFRELADYLNNEYPYTEDVFGLVLDLVNGVTTPEEIKKAVQEYVDHDA